MHSITARLDHAKAVPDATKPCSACTLTCGVAAWSRRYCTWSTCAPASATAAPFASICTAKTCAPQASPSGASTEAATLAREGHVPDEVYAQARSQFGETALVNLTLAVTTINAWNRPSIAFRAVPGSYRRPREPTRDVNSLPRFMDVNHLMTVTTFEYLLPALADSAQRGAQSERPRATRRKRTVLDGRPDKPASTMVGEAFLPHPRPKISAFRRGKHSFRVQTIRFPLNGGLGRSSSGQPASFWAKTGSKQNGRELCTCRYADFRRRKARRGPQNPCKGSVAN